MDIQTLDFDNMTKSQIIFFIKQVKGYMALILDRYEADMRNNEKWSREWLIAVGQVNAMHELGRFYNGTGYITTRRAQ